MLSKPRPWSEWHLDTGQEFRIHDAWDDAVSRGPGWAKRVEEGRAALIRRHPALDAAFPAKA